MSTRLVNLVDPKLLSLILTCRLNSPDLFHFLLGPQPHGRALAVRIGGDQIFDNEWVFS
jgi:hypothetical protein